MRVDTGVRQGDEVSVFYDPMIAKLVVHAADRPAALSAMRTALAEYQVAGLPTNLNFCDRLIAHPAFAAADLDINFIEKHNDSLFAAPPGPPPQQVLPWPAAANRLVDRTANSLVPPHAARTGRPRLCAARRRRRRRSLRRRRLAVELGRAVGRLAGWRRHGASH